MSFKKQFKNDIKNTFLNIDEFAEEHIFYYDGKKYKLPIVIEDSSAQDRKKMSSDHSDGIFLYEYVIYINQDDLGFVPKKGREFEMNNEYYNIAKVDNEMGCIILYLETLDE